MRPRALRLTLLGLALVGLAATSCYHGTYPVDIFPEMHYQQAFESYEPPRLSSPAEAVTVNGGNPPLTISYQQSQGLTSPLAPSAQAVARGATLFTVNCSMCHGLNADGQSYIADRLQQAGASRPPAFNSDRIRARNQGQIYWAVTNGVGFMPPFHKLLSDEERWSLVQFVQSKAGTQ